MRAADRRAGRGRPGARGGGRRPARASRGSPAERRRHRAPARSTRRPRGSAERAIALAPPGGDRRPPCSHTSPRSAWWASRSTCSARRSAYSRSIASTIARVQGAPPLLEQAAVGDLVRERVLEGVLEVGEQARLVEELRGLQVRRARGAAPRSGSSAMAWSSGERHVLADHRGRLEQALVLGRQAGRCARPGPPARWPAPGCARRAAPAGRRRARRPERPSRPASARSPRGRTGCPRCAR